MAKWYGVVGYAETTEVKPGVWRDQITERKYSGDVLRNSNRWYGSSDGTNDNLSINNQLSILADPYAYQNFHSIKYAEFMGTNWKVTNVEPKYPRLILTLGGVYNGEQA
jgi:hypothetical protein